nr:reverse transcriptase domain-containing protein [Tanacetum cinerariifolium]
MRTRSSARNLFPPLDNPELTIQRRSHSNPTLLNNSELATEGNGDLPNSCQLHGLPGDDANKHLDKFLHVTQSIKVNGVTDDALRLYLFPHSLTHHATAWFDRLPRNSINTFEQMAKMFLECYKLSIDRCPNHNMLPVTQIDTFSNGLTLRHRDTINAVARGTFMKRRPEECYDLIENMTAHHNDWDTSAQRSESTSSITSSFDTEIAALKAEMAKINKNLMRVLQPPWAILKMYMLREPTKGNNQGRNQFFQGANQGQNQLPTNQAPPYQALVYQAPVHQPQIPQPQVVTTNEFTNFMKANDAIFKNMQTNMTSLTNSNLDLKNMFDQFMKMNTALSLGSGTLAGNTITNSKEDLKGITTQRGTAYPGPTIPTTTTSSPVVERETKVTKDTVHPTNNKSTEDIQPLIVLTESLILNSEPVNSPINEPVASPDLNFNISFADALILMPKFGPSIKSLLTNKDKLCKLARTPLNEHCSAVLLKKLPEKLGDPDKFLISCDFPRMAVCLALADLGARINLMLFFVWNKLPFPDLSPTCMTLELSDRLISRPIGVARQSRALIDVFEGKLTLHIGKEAITFSLDQTLRYSANYSNMTANRIDVIDMACEEYSQEVLSFSDVIMSGNPTPYYDPIVSTTSPTLTPFENSDFLLEEVDAFLALEDDPTSPKVGNYLPEVRKELKICEAKSNKSSIDKPPKVELKDLPPHLEYAFLEGDDKLPVIITKDLSIEEKTALITVLKSHKRAISWKLFDIKGIEPKFYTHKILMEEDFEPAVQHQRRVNPKIHDVIKQEVLKLLDAGLIYAISDSPWYYCFLDGFSGYFQIPIDPKDQDKTTFTCPYRTFAYRRMPFRLCHAPGTFQRCMMAIFKEGIVIGHKISKNGIEVDKAKVDVIAKLPHLTTVKAFILIAPDWDMPFELMCDASDFAIDAVLEQRQEKHFRPIHYASKTMTEAESNYTTTEKEMLAVVYAFEKFRPNGEALRKCILSGPYKPTTVLVHAVEATDNSPAVVEHTTVETPANMYPENKAHFLAEKEAIHLILTRIGDDIYSTVDACQTAQKMWEAIERLQQGESLNIQDVKTNLF